MSTVVRCDFSDLPAEQCGCEHCRPDLAKAELPMQREGTWREARYSTVCACGCGRRIDEGDDIILADLDGDDGWCLLEHTRSVSGGR